MAFGYNPSPYGSIDPLNPYSRPIYPSIYQPMQPQVGNNYIPQQPQPQQMQQHPTVANIANVANTGIQWVQGIEGAKSYQVQPGTSVILMDSESQTFFIKSANAAGMPELHSYAFQEVHEGKGQVISQPPVDYVPQKDFLQLKNQFEEFQEQVVMMLKDKQEKPVKKSSIILKGDAE